MRIRHVEGIEHRVTCVAPYKHINAAPIAFVGVLIHLPSSPRRRHPRRQFWKDAGPAHLWVQEAGDDQGSVADDSALETFPREPPPEPDGRIAAGWCVVLSG